jgi:hypothetical protein
MCEEKYVKNGFIKNSVVFCNEGWMGTACELKRCKDDCNGNG